MKAINALRIDAHAKEITKDELTYFRVCIKPIEDSVESFVSG
jgi:hypothetical protein